MGFCRSPSRNLRKDDFRRGDLRAILRLPFRDRRQKTVALARHRANESRAGGGVAENFAELAYRGMQAVVYLDGGFAPDLGP